MDDSVTKAPVRMDQEGNLELSNDHKKPAPDLMGLVNRYFKFRGYKMPDEHQAMLFLVSEVGELADALVHQDGGWTRNNEKERALRSEVGDVLMMLSAFCLSLGIDPIQAMGQMMVDHGFQE